MRNLLQLHEVLMKLQLLELAHDLHFFRALELIDSYFYFMIPIAAISTFSIQSRHSMNQHIG
jgi:membrane protein insertase Oxa1/YidC/SpoIIIJ